jgi:hypothetical protein
MNLLPQSFMILSLPGFTLPWWPSQFWLFFLHCLLESCLWPLLLYSLLTYVHSYIFHSSLYAYRSLTCISGQTLSFSFLFSTAHWRTHIYPCTASRAELTYHYGPASPSDLSHFLMWSLLRFGSLQFFNSSISSSSTLPLRF